MDEKKELTSLFGGLLSFILWLTVAAYTYKTGDFADWFWLAVLTISGVVILKIKKSIWDAENELYRD